MLLSFQRKVEYSALGVFQEQKTREDGATVGVVAINGATVNVAGDLCGGLHADDVVRLRARIETRGGHVRPIVETVEPVQVTEENAAALEKEFRAPTVRGFFDVSLEIVYRGGRAVGEKLVWQSAGVLLETEGAAIEDAELSARVWVQDGAGSSSRRRLNAGPHAVTFDAPRALAWSEFDGKRFQKEAIKVRSPRLWRAQKAPASTVPASAGDGLDARRRRPSE